LIEVKIDGARGVLFSVAGGYDMAMSEVQDAAEVITAAVAPDANIIFGASIRPELEDEVVVTVVATGFDSEYYHKLDAEREAADRQAMATQTVADVMPQSGAVDMNNNNNYGSYGVNNSYSGGYSGYSQSSAQVQQPVVASQATENVATDFTSSDRSNMWDSIRTENEDDLDVPPSLRDRLRGKNKE
jgi:cell division protein FtsZ